MFFYLLYPLEAICVDFKLIIFRHYPAITLECKWIFAHPKRINRVDIIFILDIGIEIDINFDINVVGLQIAPNIDITERPF